MSELLYQVNQFKRYTPFGMEMGEQEEYLTSIIWQVKNCWMCPFCSLAGISSTIKRIITPGLMGISQRGNWKDWLLFMMSAVEYTSNITFHKINEIVSTKDSIFAYVLKDKRKFKNPEQLIEIIFTQPFTKVKHLVNAGIYAGIYAENTARDYLNKLSDMRILEKKEMEGHHYYLNLEQYRILSE